jgi:hypothetical protein
MDQRWLYGVDRVLELAHSLERQSILKRGKRLAGYAQKAVEDI